MNLFYILKLNTSYITKSDLNVKLSYEEAMLNNYIVALGDNQLFKFIRRLNDQENLIDEIYETKKIMELRVGLMTNSELAEWFGVKPASFRNHKPKKLEELKQKILNL